MLEQMKTKRQRLMFAIMVTFAWGLIAHGFRFYNLDLNHDSMLVSQKLDFGPMMSVGRFMQPVYFLFRGNLYPPALVGTLAMIYVGTAVFLTSELLDRKKTSSMILLSGIMAVNSVVTLTAASYIHVLDVYMLALLLAVWSVVVCRKGKYGFLLAVVPAIICMGLYQSYIQVAFALHIILAILALLRGEKAAKVFREGIRAVISLVIALAVYYIIYKLALTLTDTAESVNYNSLSAAGDFTESGGLLYQLAVCVYNVIYFFLEHPVFQSIVVGTVNIIGAVLMIACMFRLVLRRNIRGMELLLLVLLLTVLPVGMNLTSFLANGLSHHVMMYSFFFMYVLADEVYRIWLESGDGAWMELVDWINAAGKRLIPMLISVMLVASVFYSNQVYLKKDIEYDATASLMNRILVRIELVPGYVYGETPVAFVGTLSGEAPMGFIDDFDFRGTGLWNTYSVTFPETYGMYIHNVLNYSMAIVPNDLAVELGRTESVQSMGCFPAPDSVCLENGIVIVKLSDVE